MDSFVPLQDLKKYFGRHLAFQSYVDIGYLGKIFVMQQGTPLPNFVRPVVPDDHLNNGFGVRNGMHQAFSDFFRACFALKPEISAGIRRIDDRVDFQIGGHVDGFATGLCLILGGTYLNAQPAPGAALRAGFQ